MSYERSKSTTFFLSGCIYATIFSKRLFDLAGMAKSGDEQFLKAFGKKLKKLRIERGYSLRAFALECDMDHSSIVRLEKGIMNPSYTSIIHLAEALQIEPGELFKTY